MQFAIPFLEENAAAFGLAKYPLPDDANTDDRRYLSLLIQIMKEHYDHLRDSYRTYKSHTEGRAAQENADPNDGEAGPSLAQPQKRKPGRPPGRKRKKQEGDNDEEDDEDADYNPPGEHEKEAVATTSQCPPSKRATRQGGRG